MSKLNLRGVHVYKKVGNATRLVETHPVIRFKVGDEAVYMQDGKFYSDGGTPLATKDHPGWLAGEIAKISAEGLAAAGYKSKQA